MIGGDNCADKPTYESSYESSEFLKAEEYLVPPKAADEVQEAVAEPAVEPIVVPLPIRE